ncbi:hypothetical protein EII32_06705 [Prevotella sp. OH937_COT-195]|nr:hypothetical protein EII32_06705 [Prevotella sp. OH937_COT-195]
MPLPLRFPTALARLLTSAQPLHPDVARYAFDETAAHLLNNRTKPVEGSNDRFGLRRQLPRLNYFLRENNLKAQHIKNR